MKQQTNRDTDISMYNELEQSLLNMLPYEIRDEYGDDFIIENDMEFNEWMKDCLCSHINDLKYYLED